MATGLHDVHDLEEDCTNVETCLVEHFSEFIFPIPPAHPEGSRHNIDTQTRLPVRLVPGGLATRSAIIFSHTDAEKKALRRETVIIYNQAQKTRKGNMSILKDVKINGNKRTVCNSSL